MSTKSKQTKLPAREGRLTVEKRYALLETLNEILILHIISFLNKRSVLRLSEVNNALNRLSNDDTNRMWQSLAIYDKGHAIRLKLPRYQNAKQLILISRR
jgi:hypothetical protein